MKIEINKILASPQQIRKTWTEKGIKELAQSIQEQGLIVPIKVRPNKKGYRLVYGHRRVEAMRSLDWAETEAIVEGVDDTAALLQQIIENEMREDVQPLDKANGYKMAIERLGTIRSVSKATGIPKSTVSYYLNLLKLDKKIQDKIALPTGKGELPKGKISSSHVQESAIANNRRGQVLDKAIKENLTAEQTRRVAESLMAAPSEQRQRILDEPYNPQLWHDPEFIKERKEKHGAHDPIYRKRSPKNDAAWRNAPEVIALIDMIKGWKAELGGIKQAADINKMAPEAMQFIAGRLRRHAADCIYLADWLEEQINGRDK